MTTEGTETDFDLDALMADEKEPAAPESESQTQEGDEPAITAETTRDEQGRFAAQKTEESAEPEGEADPAKTGTVPHAALHEAREREKTEKARADALERTLAQLQGQMQALQAQVNRPLQPTGEQQQPANFWDDPDKFIESKLSSKLSPIEQQQRQSVETFSRQMASIEFGAEKVQAAQQAMEQSIQMRDPSAVAEIQRIARSEHPFAELVKWHQQKTALEMVGNDPQKWLEAEKAKLIADPNFQKQVIEAIRAGQSQQVPNGQAPVTSLPPSLGRLPGGTNTAQTADTSDEGLFKYAMGG